MGEATVLLLSVPVHGPALEAKQTRRISHSRDHRGVRVRSLLELCSFSAGSITGAASLFSVPYLAGSGVLGML